MKKEKTSLERLIGYQILSIDEKHIVVTKNNKIIVLDIEDYEGDCCGYNTIETICEYSYGDKNNPIITNVEKSTEEKGCEEVCKITFFGESKTIGYIETTSSSGSGWCYGATVTVVCPTLNIDEQLSSW